MEKTKFERKIFNEIYPIVSKYSPEFKNNKGDWDMEKEVKRIIQDARKVWNLARYLEKERRII